MWTNINLIKKKAAFFSGWTVKKAGRFDMFRKMCGYLISDAGFVRLLVITKHVVAMFMEWKRMKMHEKLLSDMDFMSILDYWYGHKS